MNSSMILLNLREAEEELRKLITEFERSPDVPFESFHVSMAHLYHHLNTAWNGRYATREQWVHQSNEDFARWERFPHDLPLIGSDGFYDLPEYEHPKDT
jgi:hypothetical protein